MYISVWELCGLALCTALFVLSVRFFQNGPSAASVAPVPPDAADRGAEDTAAKSRSLSQALGTESRPNESNDAMREGDGTWAAEEPGAST